MKKIWLFVLFIVLSPGLASAQQWIEVVYLKNGGMVRGTIVEQVPKESLKIQTADGSIFVYKMSEVEKITKEQIKTNEVDVSYANSVDEIRNEIFNGKLEWNRNGLEINGTKLNERTCIALLGSEQYDEFKRINRNYRGASSFLGWGIGFLGFGMLEILLWSLTDFNAGQIGGMISCGVGVLLGVPGLIGTLVSKGKLDDIVEKYNMQNPYAFQPIEIVAPQDITTRIPRIEYIPIIAYTIKF